MSENFSKFFELLLMVVPAITLLGSLIYSFMNKKVRALEKDNESLRLTLEYKENEVKVAKDNQGKSDTDIVMDAISEGKAINSE